MLLIIFRVLFLCSSAYLLSSDAIILGRVDHISENTRGLSQQCENKAVEASQLIGVLRYRGGAEKSEGAGLFHIIQLQLVKILKVVVPRSFWPKAWKSKNSKMMSKEHLEKSFAKGDSNSRVQKELRSFMANPPDNCKLTVGSNIRTWIISITGASDTIYAGEQFKLKIVFPKDYPSKPPSVYFLKPTPKHVHVYSNGDICLNLLGRDWRPTMTAQTLVISIISMLASAKEKKMPQDNAMHADAAPGQQQDNWMYHDDRC